MAYAARFQQKSTRVFVVVSDGECNEGSIWEAALWAPRHQLSQLTVIVDFNRFQATGSSTEITQLEPFAEKWRSFGWETVEVDGHDFGQLKTELSKSGSDRPRAVVAHTIKGKGVSFMERNLEWHYRPLAGEDFTRAMAEVSGVI